MNSLDQRIEVARVGKLFHGNGNGYMGCFADIVAEVPLTIVAAATEQSTSLIFPARCMVMDVLLDIRVAESTGGTKTVDIGTDGDASNDADGFANDISVSTAGIIRPGPAVTAGSADTYYTASTRGALLATFKAGGAAPYDVGTYNEKYDLTSGGETLTYTLGSADYEELVASILVLYRDFSNLR